VHFVNHLVEFLVSALTADQASTQSMHIFDVHRVDGVIRVVTSA